MLRTIRLRFFTAKLKRSKFEFRFMAAESFARRKISIQQVKIKDTLQVYTCGVLLQQNHGRIQSIFLQFELCFISNIAADKT